MSLATGKKEKRVNLSSDCIPRLVLTDHDDPGDVSHPDTDNMDNEYHEYTLGDNPAESVNLVSSESFTFVAADVNRNGSKINGVFRRPLPHFSSVDSGLATSIASNEVRTLNVKR